VQEGEAGPADLGGMPGAAEPVGQAEPDGPADPGLVEPAAGEGGRR
jgi:hypothetical protein